ncbi:MAG: hypothetical protein JO337_04880 [Acidimicrobiales bacterium]|nr:hypothetical protein [Acidimicrobiales bacterium]
MSGPDSIDASAEALADALDALVPAWVVRSVERVITAWTGTIPPEVALAAENAAADARRQLAPEIRELLMADIDEQRTTPLALLRSAVRFPTRVLAQAGVPPVARDRFAEQAFPDDAYDLSPASFADVDPALSEIAISWGAAKAFEHKRRRRQA